MKTTMKNLSRFAVVAMMAATATTTAFVIPQQRRPLQSSSSSSSSSSGLFVSIGLGPSKEEDEANTAVVDKQQEDEDVADYEIPDHEAFRTSRRSKIDERCDAWFENLLNSDRGRVGILGSDSDDDDDDDDDDDSSSSSSSPAETVTRVLKTPVPLVNDVEVPADDPEWTPYVNERLPWTPLTPAYGCERFGVAAPRRNAETWRHFDVSGMIGQPYCGDTVDRWSKWENSNSDLLSAVRDRLVRSGGWLDDDSCRARLVYIDGQFVSGLSKTVTEDDDNDDDNDDQDVLVAVNLGSRQEVESARRSWSSLLKKTKNEDNDDDEDDDGEDDRDDELVRYLSRLTDGYTDELVVPAENAAGDGADTLLSKLSGPNHNIGPPTCQFAINTQQGTACFAALNTIKATNVALVHAAAAAAGTREQDADTAEPGAAPEEQQQQNLPPVLIVNAVTSAGNAAAASTASKDKDGTTTAATGVAMHPRAVVVAERDSKVSIVQSLVDLKLPAAAATETDAAAAEAEAKQDDDDGRPHHHVPKLYNGYTQIIVKRGANVTHSYLQESGGTVTAGVELPEDDDADQQSPRRAEANRPEVRDTVLEAIDVHCAGAAASYKGTVVNVGGAGRVRVAMSVSLLRERCSAEVSGFSLAGGIQRADVKTNIHHVAANTASRQLQKNMIGGRAVGAFRGRIRVEQAAQQTDSQQLSRTVLLSDKARAWSVPSLEIIADDVQCTHGATVSDLSEEELFYLRSRGLDAATARNVLMYAFAGDVSAAVDPAMLGTVDHKDTGLQRRIITRLDNLVPQGERAVKGEYQSI